MSGAWTVEDVAYHIKRKHEGGRRCALLIGAGCSYQAGIPLASGFVEAIRARFVREYERAAEKTYPYCMAELDPSDRHDLICEYIDQAKINWAHISIAQLMRAGYVDRVLTTNFDPLVMRACALLNLYPAVYDMAVVRSGFLAEFVRDLAVFHLHGQRDGFVQLHRKQDVDALAEAIEPLFDDVARDRCWIIVGYSGANDPVFRVLADRPDFPNRLIWVGYRDEEPAADVRTALLEAGKNALWVKGYDPDTFLLQLASRLGCFPPGFFAKPFSHLLELFGLLAGFRLPGQDVDLDWAGRARGWIEQAIATFEGMAGSSTAPPQAAAGGSTAAPPPRGFAPPAAPPPPPAPAPVIAAPAGLELELERVAEAAPAAAPPPPSSVPPPGRDVVGEAWVAMMAGDYDAVIALAPWYDSGAVPELGEPLAWALASAARTLLARAGGAGGGDGENLRQRAAELARRADAIRPGLGASALEGR